MKTLKYKFSQQELAELLALLHIWQEDIQEEAKTNKFFFYQTGYLDNIIMRVGKSRYRCEYNATKQTNVSFNLIEIDVIVTLATKFEVTNNPIITQMILTVPDELIKLNQPNNIEI